jgi:hypothetical protein
LACLILSSHAISQGTPVDRSVTATVNRSVTFSAGSVAPGTASLQVRTQSHTAISGSPSGTNANSSPRSPKSQAASPMADLPIGRSSSSRPTIGAHAEVRVPGALGFTSSSLSVGSGNTMGFMSGAKSPEHSPIEAGAVEPVEGGISAPSSNLFSGSRQRGFDLPSSGHRTDIRGGVGSAETQSNGTRKACKGSTSNCIAEQKKRQPKHSSGWDTLHPEQNSK